MAATKANTVVMTEGRPLPQIIRFSVPLALTGILQLLFNAADVIVVGKFDSSTALAAVGATTSLINLLIGVPMCALLYFFGRPLLGIYIAKDDPAYASVLASGMVRVTYMGMTYFVCGIMETCCGMVRGLGRSWMPMVVTIFGACVLRIIWIYTIFQTHHTLDVLYLSYPVSWVVTSAVHVLCFILIYRRMMARWNAHKEEENASY